MDSQTAKDIIRYLDIMLSDDYSNKALLLQDEIGLDRTNKIVEFLSSRNILKIECKFQSNKYRTTFVESPPNENKINELIEELKNYYN